MFKKFAIGCGGVIALLIVVVIIGTVANGGKSNTTTATSTPTPVAKATATPAPKGPILQLQGNGSKSSDDFNVPSQWHFDWSYDCTSFGSTGNFVVTFTGNGGFVSGVNQLGTKDSGTDTYHSSGTYHLEIISECSWSVTVRP